MDRSDYVLQRMWGKDVPLFSTFPIGKHLRILLALTANQAYKLIGFLSIFKVVGNKQFLTTENYCKSERSQEIGTGNTIHLTPTLNTSHSIVLKQGMSRIHVVKLLY